MRGCFALIFLVVFYENVSAQGFSFGKYSEVELRLEQVSFEPEAKFVALYQEGDSYFKYGGIHTDYFFRYKVLSDELNSFGDFVIQFYRGDNLFEEVTKVHAEVSYLEDGERKSIKLGKESIKEIDIGNGFFEIRIAFPHVKKGTILEYSYKKVNKLLSLLDGWAFQKDYPVLFSKYTFKAPIFFQYQMIVQGKRLSDSTKISERKNTYSWTLENIHSLPDEPFIGTLMDYEERVDGYLFSTTYYDPEEVESSEIFYASWNQMANEMLEIDTYQSYIRDLDPSSSLWELDFSDTAELATAKKIYNHVSTTYKGVSSINLEPIFFLPDLVKYKYGNSFDKNLLLSRLLKNYGIDSQLVLINEKGNGRTNLIEKPYIFQFQSSILKTRLDDKDYFLDPLDSITPFGLIDPVRLVNRAFILEKDSGRLEDIKVPHRSGIIHYVTLVTDDSTGYHWDKTMRFTDYSAYQLKKKKDSKSMIEALQESNFQQEAVYVKLVDEFKNQRRISVNYQYSVDQGNPSMIELLPFKNSSFLKNPFTQGERQLPIEFDYSFFESFSVTIPIPSGFFVEDYPENAVITIPSKGVKFAFQTVFSQNELRINSKLEVLKEKFSISEYPDLQFIMENISNAYSQPILLRRNEN